MTCREKWQKLNPGKDVNDIEKKELCVKVQGIMNVPNEYCLKSPCVDERCRECWNQEVPEDLDFPTAAGEAFKKMSATLAKADDTVTIKDSGDRTQFETGAVRDMHEGKGRCDLAPIEVVSRMIDFEGDPILDCIAVFQKTRDSRHLYDALNTFTAAFHNQMETLILEVAKHFEEGAKKYGECNWQKGIPVKCYIDSAIRHYIKWLRGDKDEPHNRAFCWNLMCCIWEVDYSPRAEKEDSK